jgi:alkaline phosphatase
MARVTSGGTVAETRVTNTVVVGTNSGKKAKNVIFFLGDGMGSAPITAARILSKGMTEGRYNGMLEMDRMDYRGMVTTSGYDAIATDSANSMSAYMCGQKSSVNAMGVYAASEPDPAKHPRVETITELLKRTRGMSVGVVTTAEVQDATPAAVFAHTRRRSEYGNIMDQALQSSQQPDVILGGGTASLLPQSVEGSRRTDDRDLVKEFQAQGFAWAASRVQLKSIMSAGAPDKLLGLFHFGHMNFYMDREFRKNPSAPNPSQSIIAPQFNDQPTLLEMTSAALKVLEKNPNGFFLMVEGASIDKAEHSLDWQRAAFDTIEFDQALGVAKRWAANRDDTLIVVTADHNHAMSIAGTNDTARGVGRQANGVYADAGFPNYVDANGDGFPDDPDPTRTLFITFSNHPDFRDDFRFEQTGF